MTNICPEVCNADLERDLMSDFTTTDETIVVDTTCNGLLFMSDDAGLNDVTDTASGDWLTATTPRTKVIAGLSEIAAHYGPTSEVYQFAEQFFASGQDRGVAPYFILGYWDEANESISTALDEINNCNPCFLRIGAVHFLKDGTTQLMDDARMLELLDWANTNDKIGYTMSIDPNVEDNTDTTNIKAQAAALGLHSAYVQYTRGTCRNVTDPVTGEQMYFANGTPVVDENGDPVDDPANPGNQLVSDGTVPMIETYYPYTEMLAAGWESNVDLSQNGSGYTLRWKPMGGQGFVGIPLDIITNSTVTAVTGRLPDNNIVPNNNGYANVYVQNQGLRGLYPGTSVTGVSMDKIALQKYLRKQLRLAQASLFANSRRVEFDDARGQAKIAAEVESVMEAAQDAGHFTNDPQNWEAGGGYIKKGTGWVMRQASFNSQSAARKNARTAPLAKVCYIEANAAEFVPFELCTLAAAPSV